MRRIVWGILFALGIASGIPIALGYSLCKSSNHPIQNLSDSKISRVELGGETKTTVAWVAAGVNGKGIILAHGNSSDRNAMLPRMRYFQSLGYSVIAPDLNAHGETKGKWKTFGVSESRNIELANAYLRERLGVQWVCAIGASLGGAAILKAVSNGIRLDAIVIESVFKDIRTAANNRLEMRFGKIGGLLEPLLTAQLPLWLGLSRSDIAPVEWARACDVPTLVMAGELDLHAKAWESQAIFAQIPGKKKGIRIFSGAKHVDLFAFNGAEYMKAVAGFLASAQDSMQRGN